MKRFQRPIPISQRLSRALVRLVFATLVIVGIGIWVLFSGPALDRIAQARVGEIGVQTEAGVLGLYRDGERLLRAGAAWLGREDASLDHQSLNRRFIPLLAQFPDLLSLRVADAAGNEWFLGRDPDGTWLNRLTAAADKGQPTRRFLRWKEVDGLAGDERRASSYQPQDQPWLQRAIQAGPGHLVATEIDRLPDGGPLGATLALALPDTRARHGLVLALDLRLRDITDRFAALALGDQGLALLFTDQGRILSHSRAERFGVPYRPDELLLASVVGLDLGPLQDGIGRWLGRNDLPLEDALFLHEMDVWSGSFRALTWGEQKLWLGVFLPLSEMLSWLPYRLLAFAALLILVLVIGKLLALTLARSLSQPLNRIAENIRRISRWDFSLSAPVHSSMEEVERLAAAQERMRANLKRAWKILPPVPEATGTRLDPEFQPAEPDPPAESGAPEPERPS